MPEEDAFLTLDPQMTIVAWSSGVQRVFGYHAAEILGKKVFVLVPEDQRESAKDVLNRVTAEGEVKDFHTERITKSGARIKIAADLLAIKNDSGTLCAIQITVRRLW